MRSLDQIRAAHAYQVVDQLAGGEDLDKARALPMMLLQNGLLATWAFLLDKEQHKLLGEFLRHFRDLPELSPAITSSGKPDDVFRAWVGDVRHPAGLNGPQLRALSAEALALAGWIKRAVESQTNETSDGKEDS